MATSSMRRGFTLVELTLAIAFLSILLLAILYVTIQSGKLYAKGITYKNVNQASREVVDTLRRDFAGADASLIQLPPLLGAGKAQSGRVCTGQVSYVWNTVALLATGSTKIQDGSMPVIFRRVVDPGATLCLETTPGHYPMTITGMQSRELLSTDAISLATYQFTVTRLQTDGNKRGLYLAHMELGTSEEGTTLYDSAADSYTCRPPADNTANFDYCTVVDFDTIVRAGGNQ